MQCPNCGFENIPGQELCARCQGLLDLAGVDVEPPRRAQRTLVRRLRFWWARVAIAERLPLSDRSRRALAAMEDPIRSLAKWMWLPGMAYFLTGRVISGLTFLILWLAAIVLAVLQIGSPSAWFLGSLVVSVHATYVTSLIWSSWQHSSLPQRIALGLGTFFLLGACLYWPVVWAAGGLVRPITITGRLSNRIIKDGDTIVRNGRWLRPKAFACGDIVFYHVSAVRTSSFRSYAFGGGLAVDRIIGGPGDLVAVEQGVLSVNGREVPADKSPLRPLTDVPDLTITAGSQEYVILPSTMRMDVHYAPNDGVRQKLVRRAILTAALVPQDRIHSKVIWRLRPFGRFGRVE